MGKGIVKLGEGQWAVKDGNLLAAKETNGRFKNTEFTVSRGTDATYVDRDGLIVNETGNDTPRIDFTDNTDGHLLLEPQSTNLLPYSEDIASWIVSSELTLTDNSIISPSGLNDGWKVESDGTSGFSSIRYAVSISGDNTFSVYAKQGTNRYITLRSLSGVDARANFDLQEGTSTSSNATSIIEDADNGWYRCSMSFTGTNSHVYIYPNEIGTADSGYIYLQFAQLEALSHSTSYIPTNGSTVTRDAETCTGAGSSADFNSEEGVLYAEIAALVDDNSAREITLSDGTANNRIELRYGAASNRIQLVARSGGVVQASLTNSTNNILNFNKVAVKWKANDFALWINGVEQGADTSGITPVGLNELQFNEGDGAGGEFLGKCKAIKVYKDASIDLATLTS